MDYGEFQRWLELLLEEGRLLPEQVSGLLRQRRLFDEHREDIEKQYSSVAVVVGFMRDEQVVSHSVPSLLEEAEKIDRNGTVYFEPVGYRPF